MKKLITRAISGSIYVALIVVALLSGCPWAFLTLFALFTILGVNEFHNLVNHDNSMGESHRMMHIIDIVGATALFTTLHFTLKFQPVGNLWIIALLTYFITRLVAQLYAHPANHLHCLAQSMLAMAYVALPMSLLNVIYFDYSPKLLLAAFILIWLNDTGAYCVGTLIGKHRLFERISPKKSWEGFWGGLVLSVLAGYVMGAYFNDIFHGPSALLFAGWGMVVSIFATLGDLTESLMKRTAGVKDSSHLIPGHGGILDRIDSLLFAVPASLIYLVVIKNLL